MKRVIFLFAFSFLLNSCSLIFKFQGKEVDADVGEDMDSYEFNDFDMSDDGLEISPGEDLDNYEEIAVEIEEEISPTCGNGRIEAPEECDDGRNGNNDDGCRDDCIFTCHNDTECNDGHGCTQDLCNTSSHTCFAMLKGNGVLCRDSAGICDVPEYCDDSSPDCPPDEFKPSTVECRPYAVSCDIVEYCTGSSAYCPPDNIGIILSGVIAISAGGSHTCAITSGGGVKCWGSNDYGQIGDGTNIEKLTPVDVTGLSSGAIAISAGGGHTCALLDTGGVKCWGRNYYGQLGDGSNTDRITPVDVSGLSSGVTAISAGARHTCAIMNNGGIKCWGWNYYGQIGDGDYTDRNTPVDVSGLSSGVTAISAGGFHTCALTNTGAVKCWGYNFYGQLGNGTNVNNFTPVNVSGLTSGVIAISAGGSYEYNGHSCALMGTGSVKCWGNNSYGNLGDGTETDRWTPIDVIGLSSGVTAISAGSEYNCALINTGGVKCWGINLAGQLGDGTNISRPTPSDVLGLISGVTMISTGINHTCALLGTGSIKCWGDNRSGQLGDRTNTSRNAPVDVCQ